MIIGRMFAEKNFSEYNEEEERLYSTGNDELDELMEMAFCEGYEYAQKEFSTKESRRRNKEANEEDKTRRNLDIAQAGTAAAGMGSMIAGDILKKATETAALGGNKLLADAKKRKKIYKTIKGIDKASLALIGTSVGLGIAKPARDVKKYKDKKKKEQE